MYLRIISVDESLFAGEVSKASFPGVMGSFQVLNAHAPLISTLQKGIISYETKKGTGTCAVAGGVLKVLDNKIVVLAEI